MSSFRFRKSIKIAPGVRLNVGKKGSSLTVGIRGASVNFGSKGVYANVGIPGTGVSYRTKIADASSQSSPSVPSLPPVDPSAAPADVKKRRVTWVKPRIIAIFVLAIACCFIAALIFSSPSAQTTVSVTPSAQTTTSITPSAQTTTSVTFLRNAWIEGRETCPESAEYRQLVAPKIRLWKSQDMFQAVTTIPHGAPVRVIQDRGTWFHIDYVGLQGYVQAIFIVDYNPLKTFEPKCLD